MSKFQVPTVGGIRKVIQQPGVPAGTTIAELGARTVTLAQLAQLIAAATPPVNTGGGNISSGAGPSISVGPGLSGGGPIVGNVPIRLTQPPTLIAEDGADGDPGIQGVPGSQGPQGAPGAYWFGEDGADGDSGLQGPQGIQGAQGVQGIPGGAWFAEDAPIDDFLSIAPNVVGTYTVNGLLSVNAGNTGPTPWTANAGGAAGVEFASNGNTPGVTSVFVGQTAVNGFVYQRANMGLVFGTNNTDRIVINSSGNVAIQAPASGVPLTVNGVSGANVTLFTGAVGQNPQIQVATNGTNRAAYFNALIPGVAQVVFGVNNTGSTDANGFPTGYTGMGSPNDFGCCMTVNGALVFGVNFNGNATLAAPVSGSHTLNGPLSAPSSPLTSATTQAVTGLANFKPAATISTGTALTADAALTVTCNETGRYDLNLFLSFYETSVGTGGIQFDLGGGSATIGDFKLGVTAFAGGAAALKGGVTSNATAISFATITTSATAQDWAWGKGTFNVTAPGTVAVRWAQASVLSTASTNLTTGSSIILTKIG